MAPDIPVLAELGYKFPYYSSVMALCVPKKTPDEVVRKISDAVRKISEDKDFQNKNKALGIAVTYEDTASLELPSPGSRRTCKPSSRRKGWSNRGRRRERFEGRMP